MMVRAIWTGEGICRVTGDGYQPRGDFYPARAEQPVAPEQLPAVVQTLKSAALCSNAQLVAPRQGTRGAGGPQNRDGWTIQGDPTEGALVVAAAKAGYSPDRLQGRYTRLEEVPFSSERRRMSVVVRGPGGETDLHLKGAPDTVLSLCTLRLDPRGKAQPLTPEDRRAVEAAADQMAGEALRVLAVAYRPLQGPGKSPGGDPEALEQELVFLGLVGMIDPPRPEVKRAVAGATRAGIRTVMVTGDHPATALAVARELGIAGPDRALTGADVEAMGDEELAAAAGEVRVFARVSPQHKLRIVRAFKARGEVVAMTGDGVNDAPAVKEADIGVAMGRGGTDVTKEASQLVLADDNYATIVAAVEEGRGIYDNIRKFIRYLLACNTGEVMTMFLAAVARLPLPLMPIQILWVNLVTDGLPAMALGLDPTEPDVMDRPPRRPDEGVFARGLGRKILGRGVLIGLSTLFLFLWGLLPALTGAPGLPGPLGAPGAAPPSWEELLARARTLAFAGLVMAQLFHVFDCRSERRSIWEVGLRTNPWLVAAVGTSVLMLLAAIYWPPLARVMETAPLRAADWLMVVGVAGAGQALVALRRALRRLLHPGAGRSAPRRMGVY